MENILKRQSCLDLKSIKNVGMVKSVKDIMDHIIKTYKTTAWSGNLLFRGHTKALILDKDGRRCGFRLEPSLARDNGVNSADIEPRELQNVEKLREIKREFARLECELLSRFREEARPFLMLPPSEPLGWMAIAQHHGVPTRLLDWTSNLLIGLWFAVERDPDDDHPASLWIYEKNSEDRFSLHASETESQKLPKPKRGKNQREGFWHQNVCDRERCPFGDLFDTADTHTIDPGNLVPRIYYQSGLFTIHKFHRHDNSKSFDLVPLELNAKNRNKLRQVLIEPDATKYIRGQLSALFGISASKIYPDRLDAIGREARQEFDNKKKSS